MAITFKYGAPGPILQAGFAAGVGNRQKRQQEDALKIWERQNQQQFQAEQAAIGRQFQFGLQQQQFGQQLELQERGFVQRGIEDFNQQAFQAEQAGLGRDFQSGQTKALIDARSAEAGRDREHDLALAGRRESFLRDTATMEGIRSGELELPPEAQNRLRQLESGRVEAMKLDPIQKQEFMEQYEREKSTLMGLAQPVNAMPYDERVKKKLGTNYDQYKNLPWQFNNQGEMALPSGFKLPGDDQDKAANDFNERVVKRYEKLRNEKDEDTGEQISDAEAQRQAIEGEMQATQFRQSLSGGGASPAGLPSPNKLGTSGGRSEGTYGDSGTLVPDKPMAGGQVAPAATQQPTSLLTPKDIAAINAGVPMHDDLVFRKGPDGKTISGSTDFKGNFVPNEEANALKTELDPGKVGKLHDDDLRYIKSAAGQGVFPPELEQAATEEDFSRSWKKVSPGGSIMGPDGRMYIKRRT